MCLTRVSKKHNFFGSVFTEIRGHNSFRQHIMGGLNFEVFLRTDEKTDAKFIALCEPFLSYSESFIQSKFLKHD
jgi:hypothetical protein